ncbi:MAG: hypothetical protein QM760_14990 [Nibricoccus sp.]
MRTDIGMLLKLQRLFMGMARQWLFKKLQPADIREFFQVTAKSPWGLSKDSLASTRRGTLVSLKTSPQKSWAISVKVDLNF